MKILCPVCGKPTDRLIDGLCPECYRRSRRIMEPKRDALRVKVCRKCGRLYYKDEWLSSSEELAMSVEKDLPRLVKVRGELRSARVSLYIDKGFAEVHAVGRADSGIDFFYEETLRIPLKTEYSICDWCLGKVSKKKSAIVQVRASERELSNDEKKAVYKVLDELSSSGNAEALPWDVKEEAGGLDLYFSSPRAAREVVRRLSERVYFEVLETSKKVGVDGSGHEKYQSTIRLLLPHIARGDVVLYRNEYFLVKDVDPKRVTLLNLSSYEKEVYMLNKSLLSRISVIARANELKMGVVVYTAGDKVHVMSNDYKVYEVDIPPSARKLFQEEQTVGLLVLENKVLLIPSPP
ncbi:NMD3 [Thermofilum pendens Hrk 5]|uniref:NMD3 n=1 Tax=Thermofilum pendens (strain DSM 2475 / Hrk 5) TaxID=368408 RepID=A1RXD3_THEPD|nr:NMD3 [Thermofilum pendens Hrk 5]